MDMNRWTRRDMLSMAGWAGLAGLGGLALGTAQAAEPSKPLGDLLPPGSDLLAALMRKLAQAPYRRDFKTVPMMLTDPDDWDAQAMHDVLHYPGSPKMVWHNTDLAGPWLNLMRLTLNSQIWSFKHPNFLVVSVTHGPAALALFDEHAWKRYDFPKLTKGKFKRNTFIDMPPAAYANPADYQNPQGAYSAKAVSITELQKRGVVFLACHDGIWGLAGHLHQRGPNPGKLTQGELAADLTNHLIPGVILTPDVVGELVELEQAGFTYAHS
ncbi:MAG: thiosulfate dehydrogenase [Thiomonas sp.]